MITILLLSGISFFLGLALGRFHKSSKGNGWNWVDVRSGMLPLFVAIQLLAVLVIWQVVA